MIVHTSKGCTSLHAKRSNLLEIAFFNVDRLGTNFLEEHRTGQNEESDNIGFHDSKEIGVLSTPFSLFMLSNVHKNMKPSRQLHYECHMSDSAKHYVISTTIKRFNYQTKNRFQILSLVDPNNLIQVTKIQTPNNNKRNEKSKHEKNVKYCRITSQASITKPIEPRTTLVATKNECNPSNNTINNRPRATISNYPSFIVYDSNASNNNIIRGSYLIYSTLIVMQ